MTCYRAFYTCSTGRFGFLSYQKRKYGPYGTEGNGNSSTKMPINKRRDGSKNREMENRMLESQDSGNDRGEISADLKKSQS